MQPIWLNAVSLYCRYQCLKVFTMFCFCLACVFPAQKERPGVDIYTILQQIAGRKMISTKTIYITRAR